MTRTPTTPTLALVALLAGPLASSARAQINALPHELEGVSVVEHLDGSLPMDATFRDHAGRRVSLRSIFARGKPVLLNLAYFSCPVLCNMVAEATLRGLRDVQWTAGREFEVVTLSIDPRDTPRDAGVKRRRILQSYRRPEADAGWHFLVGDEASIRRVTDAVGFAWRFDERQGQYAHPAALVLVKPDGRVGRYLYGLEYRATDLRLGLLEVSEGKTITTVEHLLLYCYRYDPQGARYAIYARNVMQLGGALTALVLGLFLGTLWLRELRKARAPSPPTSDPASPQLGAP